MKRESRMAIVGLLVFCLCMTALVSTSHAIKIGKTKKVEVNLSDISEKLTKFENSPLLQNYQKKKVKYEKCDVAEVDEFSKNAAITYATFKLIDDVTAQIEAGLDKGELPENYQELLNILNELLSGLQDKTNTLVNSGNQLVSNISNLIKDPLKIPAVTKSINTSIDNLKKCSEKIDSLKERMNKIISASAPTSSTNENIENENTEQSE